MRRPMCWCAAGILMICFLLVWGGNLESMWENGSTVYLEGYVKDKQLLETFYGTSWQVTLQRVRGGSSAEALETYKGLYLCQISKKVQWEPKIGQKIRIKGKYSVWESASNPGQFDLGKWYRSQGIYGQLQQCDVLGAAEKYSFVQESMWEGKMWLHNRLQELLGDEDGALISAMILGEKSDLDTETRQLYQKNGISHILSISGLHLSLLGMGLIKILRHSFLGYKTMSVCSGVIMFGYCIFTGSSISTKRATIMFLLSLTAGILGRSYDSLSALGLAAILQLFINPYVIENSGFQLSFMAVLGVTVIRPALEKLFRATKKWKKAFLVSLSASLSTLPILLYSYGTYPWHGVVLNLLIVPAMSFLLLLSVILIFLSVPCYPIIFFQDINIVPIYGIKSILWYYEKCCQIFENAPLQDGYLGAPSLIQICIYYGLLAVIISGMGKHGEFGKKLLLLAAIQLLTLRCSFGLEITMLDVGQGDSVVIKNSNGHVYLSDCGSTSVSKVGQYRLLSFLKYKGYGKIQGIFISHLDQDHINGVEELLDMAKEERIEITYLFLPISVKRIEDDAKTLEELCAKASLAGAHIVYLEQGNQIKDGSLQFLCLYPYENAEVSNSNNGSLVLALTYDEFDMLLTGDVEKEGEEKMLSTIDQLRRFEVLKVAHHGSSGSSSKEFLEKIDPQISLISCGENNSYGHPHKETLERLEETGSVVLTTPESGAITIDAGKKIKIHKFINQYSK